MLDSCLRMLLLLLLVWLDRKLASNLLPEQHQHCQLQQQQQQRLPLQQTFSG
jgi:hypothetical protein